MTSVDILIPVLRRPGNVAPLIQSLTASTENEREQGWTVNPVFVCSAGDRNQIEAVHRENLEPLIDDRGGDAQHQYPVKINLAAAASSAEWLLLAADDLRFHDDWLNAAILVHEQTGALVVGTQDRGNDLVKRGLHSTHTLVHATYLEQGTIDEPGKLLCDEYDHNAVDVEFCETAMSRGVWAFAHRSVIEHRHPLWDRRIKRDQTYQKGIRGSLRDRQLLYQRRRLWARVPA